MSTKKYLVVAAIGVAGIAASTRLSTNVALFLNALLLTSTARAEENCGVMVLSTVRVDGVIRAVKPLAGWTGTLLESDAIDPRFVVSMSVDRVRPNDIYDKKSDVLKEVKEGTTINFAIHSPTLFFGNTPNVGESIHLQVEAMQCDGAFRRFTRVVLRPSSIAQQFDGNLEVGTTYKASIELTESREIVLTVPIKAPYHHIVGVDWSNPQVLSKLEPDRRTQIVEFKVESKEIRQVAEREWATIYKCRITRPRT